MVQYSYTVYGKYGVTGDLLLDNINPFKYKGYYYDSETGMYYCKSRYYVHEWCRWLNGDNVAYLDVENINGMNLFSYCGNNPVMGYDPNGNFIFSLLLAITGVLAAGMATGGVLGFAIVAFGGFAGGFVGNAVGQAISYGNVH